MKHRQKHALKIDGITRVKFSVKADKAKNVAVAGDFNAWRETGLMALAEENLWQVEMFLPAGRIEYRFVVDGAWINDPANKEVCGNTLGTTNNVLFV